MSNRIDGFEMMFGVNHIGHFLLTNLLLDLVKKSAPAKIVVLSSEAHRLWASMHWDDLDAKKHFSMWGRYGQSKLANLHFAKELQRRLDNEGVTNVTVNAVHPGAIRSDLGLRISSFANWINATIGVLFFKSVEQGAATTLYVAVHPDADNAKGLYFADCAVCEPASYAKDPESAKRLWDVSEELVHLKEALSDIKK
jgi:NAD(P)-dependent dehydrogenase (short-subunit alcohol dehydrogenase family)